MNEFEFEYDDSLYRVAINDCDDLDMFVSESGTGKRWEIHEEIIIGAKGACIRALLSRDTEREKIFAEAMDLARALADVLGSDVSKDQLDTLAARWQATTGEATGAEGQG